MKKPLVWICDKAQRLVAIDNIPEFEEGIGISAGFEHNRDIPGFTICTPIDSRQARRAYVVAIPLLREAAKTQPEIREWLNRALGRGCK
jgi:hypothetical protein